MNKKEIGFMSVGKAALAGFGALALFVMALCAALCLGAGTLGIATDVPDDGTIVTLFVVGTALATFVGVSAIVYIMRKEMADVAQRSVSYMREWEHLFGERQREIPVRQVGAGSRSLRAEKRLAPARASTMTSMPPATEVWLDAYAYDDTFHGVEHTLRSPGLMARVGTAPMRTPVMGGAPAAIAPVTTAGPPSFMLPSTSLLVRGDAPSEHVDESRLQAEGAALVATLEAYDVSVKIEEIVAGPTVSTFDASIAMGTKLSKVMALEDDLSLTFGRKVRIVPSRLGRVGFEVANEKSLVVGLRELLESEQFQKASRKMALPVVLGRDVRSEGVYADLADMPHVIAAGATGSGKSVGLNVMLASLLYCRTPKELRLIMIDPKVVELQPYARIPHMLLPVVTDMAKAAAALRWAVEEMERRYQLLASMGAKNITSFNAKCASDKKLPHIVIVVDEFADLVASQGKTIEALVTRLAQKSRAAGMHMILATQRPSVDVITGTIKANFPTRIAFRVAQKVDSRVVLDEQGAEHLVGRGDALVRLSGSDGMIRVQCPMLTESEIDALTGYLCTQGEPKYDDRILASAAEPGKQGKGAKSELRKDAPVPVKVWS